jgi:hypothetical protein
LVVIGSNKKYDIGATSDARHGYAGHGRPLAYELPKGIL